MSGLQLTTYSRCVASGSNHAVLGPHHNYICFGHSSFDSCQLSNSDGQGVRPPALQHAVSVGTATARARAAAHLLMYSYSIICLVQKMLNAPTRRKVSQLILRILLRVCVKNFVQHPLGSN